MKSPSISKIGWYGSVSSPLDDVIESKTRPMLIEFSKKYPDLFDFRHVINKYPDPSPDFLPMEQLVAKYAFLLDIGANGYSGRLKYLLFSKRPLFIVDRFYVEYFQIELKPFVHYIPVKMDLSDLLQQAEWAMSHPHECKLIAHRAYEFAVNNFNRAKFKERVRQVFHHICPVIPNYPSVT